MLFYDTFAKHRAEPEKSLGAYLRERRLELGHELKDRKKIYLDTNYWIRLRDEKLGKSKHPAIRKLLTNLADGAKARNLICPISEHIFWEILRQNDRSGLDCEAQLVDQLSLGVSILNRRERIRLELLYFIYHHLQPENNYYSPVVSVWNKLAYSLAPLIPHQRLIPMEENLVLQKVFVDQIWEAAVSDILEKMGSNDIRTIRREPDISEKLNTGKFAHLDENKTFEQMFLSELSGILESMSSEFQDALIYMHGKIRGGPSPEGAESKMSSQMLTNLIYHSFRLNRLMPDIPTLRIPAALHAAIRWDTRRKYKPTDIDDIRHAAAALPYFDVFLTERSLNDLVSRNCLHFHRLYRCQVVADPEEAVDLVERIINQQ
jgi:hypothetical protein